MRDGELTFGEVISGTVEVLKTHWLPFAIYILGISAVGLGFEVAAFWIGSLGSADFETLAAVQEYLGLGAGLIGIAVFVFMILAQYLLWETLLRREALGTDPARYRYIAFFFQSLLLVLLISLGTLLLIVPGLIFAARWSLAPALLIGDRQGVLEAMGNSWETIKGNTTPVVLAILVGAVVIYTIAGTLAFTAFDSAVTSVLGFALAALQQIVSQLATVALIALGIALYRRAFGSSEAITEVFS